MYGSLELKYNMNKIKQDTSNLKPHLSRFNRIILNYQTPQLLQAYVWKLVNCHSILYIPLKNLSEF